MTIEELETLIYEKEQAVVGIKQAVESGVKQSTLNLADAKEKESEIVGLQGEIKQLQVKLLEAKDAQDKQYAQQNKTKKGVNNMKKGIYNQYFKQTQGNRRLPEEFKQEFTGAVTSESQELIIKEENIYEKLNTKLYDLSNYFLKRKVSAPHGTEYINPTNDIEFAEVPELGVTPVIEMGTWLPVDYKVKKYSGKIVLPTEFLEDYDTESGAVEQFEKDLINGGIRTKNREIVKVLNTFTPKTLTNFDDVKTMINTAVDEDFNTVFIVTQSAFNDLDLAKDGNGQYLLQPNVAFKSGKSISGDEVIVVSDKTLGSKGDKVGFYGAENSVIVFDRAENYVKWADHDADAKFVKNSLRFDTQKLVEDQGFKLTFDFKAPVVDPEG